MRPLPQKFEELEHLLLDQRHTLAQNTGVPFIRLIYRADSAKEAQECQRRRVTLTRTLAQKGVAVVEVSCRGAIFAPYERRGRIAQLFELERTNPAWVANNIAQHTRQELVTQLLAAAEQLATGGVIFLVDTAFVYPYLHLAPVLDDCTNRITLPTVLVIFYPGQVDSQRGVLFLGQRRSGYYRARDLI